MLLFVKLGGSLITDKNRPRTPKPAVIARLMEEIRRARDEQPDLSLVIGHGSGSYGHVAASRHGTRAGVQTTAEWLGFVEVWREARDLNNVVLDAMRAAGLPGVAFPPSAIIQADGRRTKTLFIEPLKAALAAGLIPLVYGDVVFDRSLGGTIFSTEDVFQALTVSLLPDRILLCGLEPGVFLDYPECTQLLDEIDIRQADQLLSRLGGSASIDVTGGMAEKVRLMAELVRRHPKLQALVFSGAQADHLYRALCKDSPGTLIYSKTHHLKEMEFE